MPDSNRSYNNMYAETIAASIRDKFHQTREQLLPSSQHRRSIFRVPNMLRRHNEKAFMPEVVSIGPFHHGNTQLQAMENIKLLYLGRLICRTGYYEILETSVKAILRIQQDCRDRYADPVVDQIPFNEFIEMMVIDGHFILEFLFKYMEIRRGLMQLSDNDPVFKTSWMPRKIVADLLLLENQLPWFVLECLSDAMISTGKDRVVRIPRVASLVAVPFLEYRMFRMANEISPNTSYEHLLSCFHAQLVESSTVVPSKLRVAASWEEALVCKPIASATELLDFEVGFFPAQDTDNILDVKFEDGKMKIPEIFIEENTESLFRNLIALEHCDPGVGTQITSYAAILGCLVKSPADALHLKRNSILHIGSSGNEDPAISFLHSLRNDTSFDGPDHYLDLCRDVNAFQSDPYRSYMAILRRDYNLKDPTTLFTVVYGILFSLFLGILQTIFAILSYFK